nr:aldehyde dehydrogenase [Candidatus Enterousia merdequi]
TPDVSVVELVLNTKKKTTVEKVNEVMLASQSGILGYNEKPLVSIDFTHDKHSSVFDSTQTRVIDGNVLHITAWYDNEWGFSNRMCDTAVKIGQLMRSI